MDAGGKEGRVTLGRQSCRGACARSPRAGALRPPGLEELARAEVPRALPARVAAAARAFSAGNGYLTGLIIDRTI